MSEDAELELIKKRKMIQMMTAKTIPETVVNINSVDHFNQLVGDYMDNIIIVDFWAPWCGPCRAFAPAFEALQKEYKEKGVIFAKLNVDEQGEIANQFQVTGIPTTLFIKAKKLIHRQVGMAPKPQFANIINTVIAKNTK